MPRPIVKQLRTQRSVRRVKEAAAAERPKVPALKRGLAVIRLLNRAAERSAGVTEVATALRLNKSVSFNILKTLQEEGWVEYDTGRRRYSLSQNLRFDLSSLFTTSSHSARIHEALVRLSLRVRVPCVLSRIEPDGTFIAIDKAEETAELLVSVPIGHRFPDDAPAQMRVRLAWSDVISRRRLLKQWKPVAHTPKTIIDIRELEREIDATTRRGYAISRAEFTPGVMSLAAPIFAGDGRLELILQCPGVEPDVAAREAEIAEALIGTAKHLSYILATP
jgi:DNA-binding IclR family transcriptional regulator